MIKVNPGKPGDTKLRGYGASYASRAAKGKRNLREKASLVSLSWRKERPYMCIWVRQRDPGNFQGLKMHRMDHQVQQGRNIKDDADESMRA